MVAISPPVPRPQQLAELLAPVTVEQFIGEYAGRRALLIKGTPDKFAVLDFDQEAFLSSAERFDPGANRLKAAIPSAGEAEQYRPALPSEVRALYHEEGLTVCAAGLSDVNPVLGAFAEGVRMALSIPDLRFNAYLSPHGSGFNLHYDVQPIFLIQIAGAKHWWYSEQPQTPMPRVYSSQWQEKPDLDSLQRTVLEPGDVLYLPAFSWHRARAEGFSLGITLGVKGAHNRSLRLALERSPLFGEWPIGALQPPIDPVEAAGGEVPPSARDYLEAQRQALRDFAQALTIEDLWKHWIDDVQTPKGPVFPRGEGEVYSTLELRRAVSFPVHREATSNESGEPQLVLRHAGHRLVLEGHSAPLVEWLLGATGHFSAAEAIVHGTQAGLTRAQSKRVLRDLLALGVLELAAN